MSEPESAFRQQFSSWSNNNNNSSNTRTSLPPFSSWSDYIKTSANDLYVSLPSYNTGAQQAIEEPSWFKLSRFEKMLGFACCLGGSALCFIISFFLFPVLALKPRKFGLLWSMGSFLFVISFGILQGPYHYTKHLLSKDRIVFTSVFFGSVLSTMYAAVILKSTLLTIFCCVIEIFAVLYYTLSYFPFGAQTVTFFTSYIVGYVGGLLGGLL
ncbi:uncharacterized protein AC631_05629 [Debaryomyces fabryi]|uniref:Protein transport protein SFT2 n=1 Tax=Debaryomyces fabryi TaxID=58627 RepID=A0A0V1PQV0_9ASCO|nr:uncharacterized protein AC631_05629 [Debaryomyces fabryi]KRZ98613.1 hypothetical protein AC631_05629 [Debaryomyces fabryi]CUM46617.1 unnamed protein product [Debaryomyces fabryi]